MSSPQELTPSQIKEFRSTVLKYYEHNKRDLPWRKPQPDGTFDPYCVLVSEVMLQQTQVARVVEKYTTFLRTYPTATQLAKASFADVLGLWSGLGYNRRAQYLHHAAKHITELGRFPNTIDELTRLPGIGYNTAAAILVYSFNRRFVYTETNIRTVYIHHFFADSNEKVHDQQIEKVLNQTLPTGRNPDYRTWYWALMDYGTQLKKTHGTITHRSQHYVSQSAFKGSRREIRGRVMKLLLSGAATKHDLSQAIPDERLDEVLNALLKEGLVCKSRERYRISDS